eukprot:7978829-Pyramimonas_sp.AAC.1
MHQRCCLAHSCPMCPPHKFIQVYVATGVKNNHGPRRRPGPPFGGAPSPVSRERRAEAGRLAMLRRAMA